MERRPSIRLVLLLLAAVLLLVAAAVAIDLARRSGDGGSWTSIPSIQGRGRTSPLAGQRVSTRGVVTRLTNNGFFLQDAAGDGDPRTSDALQVFTHDKPAVVAGQLVRLSGLVTEFNTGASGNAETAAHTVTQLRAVSGLQVLGVGPQVRPVPLRLPVASDDEFEPFEGMLVSVPGRLTVSQNHFLGRYGQLTLSAGGRLLAPTNLHRPGALAQSRARADRLRTLLLDDGDSLQNPAPVPYLGEGGTVRAGDTVDGLTGVLDYGPAGRHDAAGGHHKIHPSRAPVFIRSNPRPGVPPAVGGDLKIAGLNLQNYFTSLKNGRQGCAPGGLASDCRGARNEAEFDRQRAKIVETLALLDADAVGLMEIENNGDTALRHLVDALNQRVGAGRYAAVPEPAAGFGGDATRVALIYQPARLRLAHAALVDTDPVHHRAPLAQTFMASGGQRFNVVVSHFKSKSCKGAQAAELDQGDLQACFNARRLRQARALLSFVESVQARTGTAEVLLLGDFNALAHEDPVRELLSGGFVDELGRFDPAAYTYVFDGFAGRLDHVLASPAMSARVTRAAVWHINADEPAVLDYQLAFKPQDLYTATPYRSADHDPVLLGLRFGAPPPVGAMPLRDGGERLIGR